jgi:hypothetical protein
MLKEGTGAGDGEEKEQEDKDASIAAAALNVGTPCEGGNWSGWECAYSGRGHSHFKVVSNECHM